MIISIVVSGAFGAIGGLFGSWLRSRAERRRREQYVVPSYTDESSLFTRHPVVESIEDEPLDDVAANHDPYPPYD